MGIDPGLASTGVGVIERVGSTDTMRLLASAHVTTHERQGMPERLAKIHDLVRETIERWRPGIVAIESVFFAKNVKSAVLMSHGRGAAILAAHMAGIELCEYSPLEIKQSVVGKGRASKDQVKKLVEILLKLDVVPASDHETDAIACAICHVFREKMRTGGRATAAGPATSSPTDQRRQDQRKALLALSMGAKRGRKKRR